MGADMITNDDMRRFAEFMLARWLERDPAAGKMRKRPKMKELLPRSKRGQLLQPPPATLNFGKCRVAQLE
jgi:hypothetical protein